MTRSIRVVAAIVVAGALLASCGSDIHDIDSKQKAIDACTDSGGYPMLDPRNFYAVYCSRVPVCAPRGGAELVGGLRARGIDN